MWASEGGYANVVQLLLDVRADKDATDEVGYRGAEHGLELRAAAFVARRCKRGTILTRVSLHCRMA